MKHGFSVAGGGDPGGARTRARALDRRSTPPATTSVLIYRRMNLEKIAAPDFDLQRTLDSGQVFHWEARGSGSAGTMGDRAAYPEQRGSELFVNREIAEMRRIIRARSSAAPKSAPPFRGIRRWMPRAPIAMACAYAPADLGMPRRFHHQLDEQVAHIRDVRALRESFGAANMIYGSHVYAFPLG